MKNSDIAAIILIASLSVLAAYFIADSLIGRPGGQSAKVKTVEKISAEIQEPDVSVFNKDAINPTVPVVIGDGSTSSTQESKTNAASTTQQQQSKQ